MSGRGVGAIVELAVTLGAAIKLAGACYEDPR